MSWSIKAAGCLALLTASMLFAKDPAVIEIGLVDSLVKNLTPAKRKILDADFSSLVQDFTGFKSQAHQGGDPITAAKKLADGQWHLGVFQGVEFAWAQAEDSKLQPLMIAIRRSGDVHAVVVANKDSGLTGFADLKGKIVWVQPGKEHCRLFAERGAQGDTAKHFAAVETAANVEESLDAILRGKFHAGVVDNASLQDYKEINPGKFNRLKILTQSEPFPPAVIAYRQAMLSEAILSKFKNGMFKANETEKGRDAMANMQITAFEAVPPNFGEVVKNIVKLYPSPSAK